MCIGRFICVSLAEGSLTIFFNDIKIVSRAKYKNIGTLSASTVTIKDSTADQSIFYTVVDTHAFIELSSVAHKTRGCR